MFDANSQGFHYPAGQLFCDLSASGGVTPESSRRCGRQTLQLNQTAHVVAQVFEAYPRLSANQSNAAHQRSTVSVR